MNRTIWSVFLLLANSFAYTQVKITTVKNAASSGFDYSFPLIRATKKKVADKINSYLQSDILSNESIQTKSNKIFANTIEVGEDSIWDTGITRINYDVVINDKNILSLHFFLETMAAYPDSHHRYYNFNTETGELITTKDLITPAGIIWLKRYLVAERASRISKQMTEIEPLDSSGVRESFITCNEEAEEGLMFLQNGTLRFYKYGCLGHAIRAYDLDWDLELDLQLLSKYFTPFAEKVLRLPGTIKQP